MLNLKKLSLNTVTISNLDTTKIVGGAASKTPQCVTDKPEPIRLTDGNAGSACCDSPTMFSGCC